MKAKQFGPAPPAYLAERRKRTRTARPADEVHVWQRARTFAQRWESQGLSPDGVEAVAHTVGQLVDRLRPSNPEMLYIPEELDGFIWRRVQQRALNAIRSADRELTRFVSLDSDEVRELAIPEEDRDLVAKRRALLEQIDSVARTLPPRCQEIWFLAGDEMTYAEIAAFLRIDRETVRENIARANRIIRVALGKAYEEYLRETKA